jgi:transposase, IS5 family
LIKHQRYDHAKRFRRAKAKLKTLKTHLGRTIRDIVRKIAGDSFLQNRFAAELYKANRVLTQKPRDRGRHIYALRAPEVECIGKGKPHRPYEFGVKATIATTPKLRLDGPKPALGLDPGDAHRLETVLPDIEALTGTGISRVLADGGYKGRMKQRAAVEPVIGHIKNEYRMNRCYLAYSRGDAENAMLAAVGYNFGLILK